MLRDESQEQTIRYRQAESFGHLMAGFSHDMKNHMGIIRESNGLIGDLVTMSGAGGDTILAERLSKAVASIEQRVSVVAELLHYLSRLAHRADVPVSSFQLNEAIKEESVFLERFAKLAQVSFALELGSDLPALYSNPSLLQHVVYRLYMTTLTTMETGGELTVATATHPTGVAIIFRSEAINKGNALHDIDPDTMAAVDKLGGTLQERSTPEGMSELLLCLCSSAEEEAATDGVSSGQTT